MGVYKSSQAQRTLRALQQGDKTNFELAQIALKYTSIISDLRKAGYNIVGKRKFVAGKATGTWIYHLMNNQIVQPKPKVVEEEPPQLFYEETPRSITKWWN